MKTYAGTILKKEDEALIEKIRAAIVQVVPDATVILYGSRARGEPEADSDWDILILTETVTHEIKSNLTGVLFDIELEDNVIINPLILPKDEWEFKRYRDHPIRRCVDAEGILIR